MPYTLLRMILPLVDEDINIDEAIIRNDAYIRANAPDLDETEYTVTTGDFIRLLEKSSSFENIKIEENAMINDDGNRLPGNPGQYVLERKVSPLPGAHYVSWTSQRLEGSCFTLQDSRAFSRYLEVHTHGLPSRLPWGSVFLAGSLVNSLFMLCKSPGTARENIEDNAYLKPLLYHLDAEEAKEVVKKSGKSTDMTIPLRGC